ncbi:MAG TPA: hypothetical protein P5144_09900 [Thermoanaerobaculia bacterium]|nr:hypothetical protein [Thermoanaerobaculia bacterium]HRS36722.1 hypothetical protein [Thermoanaerobaculia bacterium]HRU09675.1 hypothetical protein [Thermoanaerobaculia bacterium]
MNRRRFTGVGALAVFGVLLAFTATAAFAANTITVPAGSGGGTCGPGNYNSARFSGDCGAQVTFDGSTNSAFVQDNSPAAEATYSVRFYVNLREATTAGDGYDLFVAASGTEPVATNPIPANASRFRAFLTPATFGEETLFIAARKSDNTEITSAGIPLKHGWHSIEVRWLRSDSSSTNGKVELWVNGVKKTAEMAAFAAFNNNISGSGIDYVRWGAVAGVDGGSGKLLMDDFVSQRSGYIGPVQAFTDVPFSHQFFKEIQGFYASGVTTGCTNSPLAYCPTNPVNRGAMAVFIMRAKATHLDHNPNYNPPPAVGIFHDPEFDPALCGGTPSGCSLLWMEPWAEALYNAGITTGCDNNPLRYCPGNVTNRGAMAVFILRALEGASYAPPAASGVFTDPEFDPALCGGTPSGCALLWMEPWAEELLNRGITSGCNGPTMYCPGNGTLRQAMAAFLSRGFAIPYHFVGP